MTERSADEQDPDGTAEGAPGTSTELVVRETAAAPVAPARGWQHAVVGFGRRLPQLLRHPAAVASVSVVATVGTSLLVNGLRGLGHPARPAGSAPDGAGTAGPVAIAGYVLHEVHVIHHHVVHHVARPPLG